MATTHQPLLDTPKMSSTFSCKAFLLFLFSAAIICPSAFVAIHAINTTPHLCLPSQLCSLVHDKNTCLQMFLNNSLTRIVDAKEAAQHISRQINDALEYQALVDCVELMDLSIGRVKDSAVAIGRATTGSFADAHAWLSSILTNHMTCHDGLTSGLAQSAMKAHLQDLIAQAKTTLEMFVTISPPDEEAIRPLHGEFPSWVTYKDRKLLESLPKDVKPNANVVVAQDGSGNYWKIQKAVDSAPDNGNSRYVIYVKKGTYMENVVVGPTKKNVMIVGDGKDVTIVTGSRYCNNGPGSTTLDNCATLAAVAEGFILQDICIENTAGPEAHQAIALRVHADHSVINRCHIDGYQGTLYAHSLRQFYRESDVCGTIDFIFGDATAVFQNCQLLSRKPMNGQSNMVTAHGRYHPDESTVFSIQNCTIKPKADLAPVNKLFPTYLGRPWKEYSRTVVMQSYIKAHIDPKGWSPWNNSGYALSTLYFGEYSNRGPGAGLSGRVKWKTFHSITEKEEATKFTVKELLIKGEDWLRSTEVAYNEGLYP